MKSSEAMTFAVSPSGFIAQLGRALKTGIGRSRVQTPLKS